MAPLKFVVLTVHVSIHQPAMHAWDSESGVLSLLHALQRSLLIFYLFWCKGRHVVLAYKYVRARTHVHSNRPVMESTSLTSLSLIQFQ
jgi:hypothetical protein